MFKYFIFAITNILVLGASYCWIDAHLSIELLKESFTQVKTSVILISSIPYIGLLIIYGLRTAYILNVKFGKGFGANIIGHGLNNIFPYRLGELLRIFLVRRYYSWSFYKFGLSVVLEKAFDLACVSLLGFIALFTVNSMINPLLLTLIFGVAAVIISIIFVCEKVSHKLSEKILILKSPLRKINEAIQEFHIKKRVARISLMSLIIWSLSVAQFFLYFHYSLLGLNFSITDSVLLVVVTAVTFALPITVASIGVFEGVVVYYLGSRFHIPYEQALVLSGVLHLLSVVPQIMFSLFVILINESLRVLGMSYASKTIKFSVFSSSSN